jgi:uncharacterized membrane protein YciS (DUF1049 family)
MLTSLMKLLRGIFWFLIAISLIFFSVNNRHDAGLKLDPLFADVAPIPVYIILFAGIFIGILITGMSLSWLRLKGFTRRRKVERTASQLEEQVTTLSEDLHKNKAEQAHSNKSENTSIVNS